MSTGIQTTPEPGVITFLTTARAMVLIVSVVHEVEEATYALVIIILVAI